MNARQIQIQKVTVNEVNAEYLLFDYQKEVPLAHTTQPLEGGSIHNHAEFARMLEAMAEQANEGELEIAIPETIQPTPVNKKFLLSSFD